MSEKDEISSIDESLNDEPETPNMKK